MAEERADDGQKSSAKSSTGLVIIGAGPAALHVVARLPRQILKNTIVIDRRGGWLEGWKKAHEAIGTRVLRSPVNQNPATDPTALRTYAEAVGRELEMVGALPGFLPLPTLDLFYSFCHEKIIATLPQSVRGVRVDEAVNIQVLPSENGESSGTPQSRCRITLASGGDIEALAVVFTGSGAETSLPEWASLEEVNSGPLLHARDVDLSGKGHELSGKVVVVVGGGMSAAQLALGAARAGAAWVRLVCRRPLLPRPFDYDPKSTGGMFRHQLERTECPGERLKATRVAKGRGSINPPVLKELREEVIKQDSNISVHEAQIMADLHWTGKHWEFSIIPTPLPNGTRKEPNCIDWEGAAAGPDPGLEADVVWAATGKCSRMDKGGLLSNILTAYPIPQIGGYPVLDHNSLRWPGALPLLCLGRSATISIGPAAAQMAGFRESAQTIAAYLTAHWPNLPQVMQSEEVPGKVISAQPLDSEVFQQWRPPPKQSPEIDTSCILPSHLPKTDVAKYSWSDDEFIITLTIPIPEPVTTEDVYSSLLPTSLDLWAVGSKAAYRFRVQRFYEKVLVDRCKIRYSPKKQAVVVSLHKYSTMPWRFLKQ